MKKIHINDSGYVWEVPLSAIATNRAKFYAKRDKDTTFQEEYDYVMEDRYEGIDWFRNNMNFVDVKVVAVLIQTPEPLSEPRINTDTCTVELVP